MKTTPLTALAVLYLLPLMAVAGAEPPDLLRMDRAIDLRVKSGQFMGAVLVGRDGRVLFNKAYGLANVTLKIANQPETRFRVAAVSQQLTAAAILFLADHGRLKLDDRISRYLPDAPEEWKEITFYHLLTHTSGIPNLTSFPDYSRTEGVATTPRELVDRFRDRRLDFRPGTSWNYSNSGYILLGYLIEQISGMPYGRFVQQHLLSPLKMWSSGYDPNAGREPWQAQGHVSGQDGLVAAPYIDMSVSYSAGGIYSTCADLLKWATGLYGGKLLRPASLQRMLTPYKNHHGLGVVVEQAADGSDVYSVGGGIEGFNARVVYESDSRVTLIVLSNLGGDGADEISDDLRKVVEGDPAALASDKPEVTVADDALERLTGRYWSEEGTIFLVTRKDDHLQLQGGGGTRDLYAQSATDFVSHTQKVELTFDDELPGHVRTLVLRLPSREVHAQQIGASEAQAIFEMRARKLQAQSASPGSREALQALLDEIAAGTPDYSRLGLMAGDLTRRELPRLHPLLERLGHLQRIDFVGVVPVTAADMYVVTFEHGPVQARIAMGPDGRIWSQEMRPLPPGQSVPVPEERISSGEQPQDAYSR